MTRSAKWLAGFLLFFAVLSVDARVIFDNGVTTLDEAWASDFDLPHFMIDDFVLDPGSNVITDIHWTGVYAFQNTPQATDNFTIEIFADVGGAPDNGPALRSFNVGDPGRTDTDIDLVGFDVFSYDVDIAPLALAANTTFWLSIINDTTVDQDDDWFWGSEKFVGNSYARSDPADSWFPVGSRQDFQLTSSVPEPTTLLLLGLGLAGLGLARRRLH